MLLVRRSCVVVLLAGACCSRDAAPPPTESVREEEPVTPRVDPPTSEPTAEPIVVADTGPVRVMPIELFPALRSRSALQLFETDDGALFVVANVEAVRLSKGGPLARERRFLAGIADPGDPTTVSWRATAFGGRWPDALHMVVEAEGEARWRTPEVYRFAGDEWTQIDNTAPPLAWSFVGFSPWRDRDTLTLRTWAPMVAPIEDDAGGLVAHAQLRDMLLAKAPRAFDLLSGGVTSTPRLEGHEIGAFDSLQSGHAIAVSGSQTLHWSPESTSPRTVVLDPPPRAAKLEMFAADDAYLLDERGLSHYDGAAWTPVAVPDAAGVDALALAADGTLWIVTDGDGAAKLLERRAGEAWRERRLPDIAFPGDAAPVPDYSAIGRGDASDVVSTPMDRERAAVELPLVPVDVASVADSLWITAREHHSATDDHWALLHTAARDPVIELPDLETMRRELIDAAPELPFAAGADCEVFVPIAVPRVAGLHADLQRQLMAVELEEGATILLLEVVRDGKPALGVVLPKGGESNEAIVSRLRKKLGKRMRPPICQAMIPRRQLARFP